MGTYKADRDFSDYVHDNIAVPLVYNNMGWGLVDEDEDFSTDKDIHDGVDYTVFESNGRKATIQERFRDNYYGSKYNDVTIRYSRNLNPDPSRKKSEYFKITAKYFVYGTVNGSKYSPEKLTGFEKLVILNLYKLIEKVDNGKLLIDKTKKFSYIKDEILYAGFNHNSDGSSEFIVIDVHQMQELWGKEVVFYTEGY